ELVRISKNAELEQLQLYRMSTCLGVELLDNPKLIAATGLPTQLEDHLTLSGNGFVALSSGAAIGAGGLLIAGNAQLKTIELAGLSSSGPVRVSGNGALTGVTVRSARVSTLRLE